MTKTEFIERYGEDAYKEHLKKQKQYRDTHSDEIRKKKKKHYNTHKEKILKKQKEYRDTHLDEKRQKKKQYRKTPKGRAINLANAYSQTDKERGFDTSNNVKASYIVKRIFSSKCVYCGDSEWRHLGCDRIDNTKGHTPDNVVPCCGICNAERQWNKMSMDEMLEYRTTNPRILRNMNVPIEKTPTGAIKKRIYTR